VVRGRRAGSFGHMACFSFYANNIVTTGEGGMVVTDDPGLAERLRSLRNLAFGEPRFVHREPAFNFRMTGYQAAMGRVQLRRIDAVLGEKRRVAALYDRHLADVPGLRRPVEREWARNVHWMYWIALEDGFPGSRDDLMARLGEAGDRHPHALLPDEPPARAARGAGFRPRPCLAADRLWERGLYLPSSPTLSDEQVAYVAARVRERRRPGGGKVAAVFTLPGPGPGARTPSP
jgi:perosamine synthetase